MTDKLSDIDYIKHFDQLIGEQYEAAKNLYHEAPIQTLVSLRALIAVLCKTIVEEHDVKLIGSTLVDTINSLKSEEAINHAIINMLHSIRCAGNTAAHPEQFNLSKEHYATQALTSLKQFCELVKTVRLSLHGQAKPNYVFDEHIQSSFKALSFKVLFENDTEAKYKVAMALLDTHNRQVKAYFGPEHSERHFVYYDDNLLYSRALDLLEEAAQSRHIEAMYDYGHILAQGNGREKDLEKAIGYFWDAASRGHINAKAFFGLYIAESESPDERDIEYALEWLLSAAESNNPVALHTLAALHSQGKFLEKNGEKALIYLKSAAEEGFPGSQHQLAVYYWDFEQNYALCEENLIAAIEQEYSPAILALARLTVFKAQSKSDYKNAADLYRQYLKQDSCPEALFGLSELVLKYKENDTHTLAEVMGYQLNCYRNKDCPAHIAEKVEKSSLGLLEKLASEFNKQAKGTITTKAFTEVLIHYNKNGKPYKTNNEAVENLGTIAKNPYLMSELVYTPKLTRQNARPTNMGPYDICPICDSGKIFKDCCGKVFN
jgi:TPR repeat protein